MIFKLGDSGTQQRNIEPSGRMGNGVQLKNNQSLGLPRIICVIPALPSEVKLSTLRSIFSQTIPVDYTILLTKKVQEKLRFPVKISLVLNEMLKDLKLENFDYLLRVDTDTVLPDNFIEENLKLDLDVLGWGCAELVKIDPFLKVMGGQFHPEHDDGYIHVKMRQVGLKSSQEGYAVKPICIREPGKHHGNNWFFAQGVLDYQYGFDPAGTLYNAFAVFGLRYAPSVVYGYIYGVINPKIKRFDVASVNMQHYFRKYWQLNRWFKVTKIRRMVKL